MSSKSLNKFHPALNLFFYTVKRTMGLTVLITAFLLLICPGYILMYLSDVTDRVHIYNFNNMIPSVTCFLTVATSGTAVLNLFIDFLFLYSRKSGDLFHSLPVTRGGMFVSRFFASVVPQLIPMALTYISMCVIITLDGITGSFKMVLAGFVYNILIVLMCCAFTMLFIVCAGSVADLILSFFSYNIGVLLLVLFANEMCCSLLAGFDGRNPSDWLYSVSPFIYGFANQFMLFDESNTMRQPVSFAVNLVLIALVSFLVSYLLYNRRKSERGGISYAYRFIYVICTVVVGLIGGFGLGSIFAGGEYNVFFWIFAAVGAVLAAITFGAINDRGFKTVKRSVVFGVSSAVIIGAFALVLKLGCFGFTSRVPKNDSVKSVSVSFGAVNADFEDPSAVTALHKAVVESEKYDDMYSYLRIDYALKNGSTMERYFNVDYNDFSEYLLGIIRSDENIQSIREEFAGFEGSNLWISESWYYTEDGETSSYDEDKAVFNAYLTSDELNRIIAAYTEDMKKATMDSVNRAYAVEYSISGIDKNGEQIYSEIYVEEGFEKTKEVIAALKLSERVDAEN